MKHIPNILASFRILASFAIIPLMMYQCYLSAAILFILASISDFFDGVIAKKFNFTSKIGGVLDHIGDKFLVTVGLVMMILFLQIWLVIIPAILLICRELYVSGLREFMGTQKIEMPVPAYRFSWGKIKNTLQMVALSLMFIWVYLVNSDVLNSIMSTDNAFIVTRWTLFVSIGIMWASLVASLISAGQYTKSFAANLKKLK